MAETKTEIAQKTVVQITDAAGSNVDLDGSVKRATRDSIITKELELIKNAVGDDRIKYAELVVSKADKVILENKDALIKLKQLRNDPNANPDEVKKLFNDNPKLLEARAYLILASSFGDKSKYADYIDNDGSTLKMIELLSEKAKEGVANTDAVKGLNSMHDASIVIVEEQLALILKYVTEQNAKAKAEATTDKPQDKPAEEASAANKPEEAAKKPDESKAKSNLDYDPAKIKTNVTAKYILGDNHEVAMYIGWLGRAYGADVAFNSPAFRFPDDSGNPNIDGKVSYIRGDGKEFLRLRNPTDLIANARTTPDQKEDNYAAPDYSNLGIYRIGKVRIDPKDYNENPGALDLALQVEIERFLKSDEKALPVFLVKTGQGWLRDGVEGAVVYLPRDVVIKQLGLQK